LLGSVAVAKMDVEQRSVPPIGEPPSHVEAFSGCGFAGRCHRKLPGDICDRIDPPLVEAGAGHHLRCHIPLDVLSAMEPVFSRRPHPAERE
jgi:peptide/nickel transport system ATP-binding protein